MNSAVILTYHSLDDSGSVISTAPELFRRQMQFLAASGMPVLPLDQAVTTPGTVAITFDDGFANLRNHAFDVLDRYGLPATIFVVAGHCGGRNNWCSQPHGVVPDLPLLDWHDLGQMPKTITVGAHTMTHPHLEDVAPGECEQELANCREGIEQRLGRSVRWLAYPYGTSTPEVRAMAARYFDLAVGTRLAFLPPRPECMDLPRIDTYYLTGGFGLEQLFSAPGRMYIGMRRLLRAARRHAHVLDKRT